MEQIFRLEIMLDKVTIYPIENENPENKNLIIKINFGPSVTLVIKENEKKPDNEKKPETKGKSADQSKSNQSMKKEKTKAKTEIKVNEDGKLQWSRRVRMGKSYIFPSYPDTVMHVINKFPLEVEIWNDDLDESDREIFVGIGKVEWDPSFYEMLREVADACRSAGSCFHAEPCTMSQKARIYAECCCRVCGEVDFLLRLSALGEYIITEFVQIQKDGDKIFLRSNTSPDSFECKRVDGEDPNFLVVGSIYESTTIEDPSLIPDVGEADKIIQICTDLQSCKTAGLGELKKVCTTSEKKVKKKWPIEKIRMGDIVGPCGNANCTLAHKVKKYIRNLETYQKQASKAPAAPATDKDEKRKNACGACVCKDDKWHRADCPDADKNKPEENIEGICKNCGGAAKKTCDSSSKYELCKGCGGSSKQGETCADKKNQECDDKTKQINFFLNFPRVPGYTYSNAQSSYSEVISFYDSSTNSSENKYSQVSTRNSFPEFLIPELNTDYESMSPRQHLSNGDYSVPMEECDTSISEDVSIKSSNKLPVYHVYNVTTPAAPTAPSKKYPCSDVALDRICKCNPPKPQPPCRTTDCDCLQEMDAISSRKQHRAYCPSFKHKASCPVTLMNEEGKEGEKDDEEEAAEPLPYGLPPVKLGPCPVLGRPCSVPDGFARMYKNALNPPQPPSYSDAGKVCCYKEYIKIKKALKEYLKYEKDNDFRCINKFNVDTERRCCDKEQKLFSMLGRGCCGAHKLDIQKKFEEK